MMRAVRYREHGGPAVLRVEVARQWAAGRLRVAIAGRVPPAEVTRAHEILDARANLGRIVLIP